LSDILGSSFPSITTSPFVETVKPGKAVEESGLAAAAGTHDGHHLAALHHEVNASQGLHLYCAGAVGLMDSLGADYVLFLFHSSPLILQQYCQNRDRLDDMLGNASGHTACGLPARFLDGPLHFTWLAIIL
jgi:hypothetical protein